jgi:hypothetical protein
MEENKIITLRQPGEIADPLTEALRDGARALLAQAVEAEVAEVLGTIRPCFFGDLPAKMDCTVQSRID